MCVQFSEAERCTFWGVKAAFDPLLLLNRDKTLPTKVRCAEYGKVREGKSVAARFPELEIF